MITMKAQYISGRLKRDVQRLDMVADQLASGKISAEGLPPLLQEVERDLRCLSKTAERPSF